MKPLDDVNNARKAVGVVNHSSNGREVRIGQSWNPSARAAGIEAAQQAMDGPAARLLLIFASFGYPLRELLDGVDDVAGDVPTIGCSTAGEIGPGPLLEPSVVIVGFHGDFTVTTSHATGLDDRSREVGADVATGLLPLPERPHRTVIMLTDALAGDQQEMVRGAYGVLGAGIPLVGGGAGDDMRMITSRQIFNGKILQDTVVAACIGSDGPFGLSVRHGWQSRGESIMVTASCGNAVYTLDDLPALDLYLERHQAPPGVEMHPAAFAEFALTRPLTVARRGDVAVRHVLGADLKSRALKCAGPMPRGAAVWLATGDVESTIASAELACSEAVEALGGEPPLALLVFDCAGRRAVLGDAGLAAERQVMRGHTADRPLAGFYSFGEIGRLRGAGGFHNQTFVAFALG